MRSARGARSSGSPAKMGWPSCTRRASAGINFLDDARYNDETGTAPIPTGYSEVLFGELFREAGWHRDETWSSQQAVVGVLAGAERRRRARRLAGPHGPRPHRPDLRQPAARRPAGRGAGGGGGRADRVRQGARLGDRELGGGPLAGGGERRRASRASQQPCAAQLPYSLVQRDWVESPEMARRSRRPAPAWSRPSRWRAAC